MTGAPGESIFPPLSRLREVSRLVAVAVAQSLVDAGAAPPIGQADIERRIDAAVWEPAYLPYRTE